MLGVEENLLHRPLFDDAAGVHHDDVVRHLRDDAEVVRDEHNAAVDSGAHLAQQVENLRLNGDVQRGRRLVGDDELRVAGQRHRNHHALPHTAGQLVRIALIHLRRARDADKVEHFDGLFLRLLLIEAQMQGRDLV